MWNESAVGWMPDSTRWRASGRPSCAALITHTPFQISADRVRPGRSTRSRGRVLADCQRCPATTSSSSAPVRPVARLPWRCCKPIRRRGWRSSTRRVFHGTRRAATGLRRRRCTCSRSSECPTPLAASCRSGGCGCAARSGARWSPQPREAAYCIPRKVFDARLVEAAQARGAVLIQRRIRTLTIERRRRRPRAGSQRSRGDRCRRRQFDHPPAAFLTAESTEYVCHCHARLCRRSAQSREPGRLPRATHRDGRGGLARICLVVSDQRPGPPRRGERRFRHAAVNARDAAGERLGT